mmetsp:Transcript_19930/g.55113  ORF Transcript_19930/g.55113 Transcript_19930/m.55113 type:complete len:512 (+) Transcript_19930:99-1634(+)|eukprot:CAMPEP_0117563602 /NCGR_PEP_ID=MMETSP0784-20121206/55581_1 /TAXON_ID=39447 /ORGANISM="" /LENGTH=511 /DNA_ID=CAMNT_0005361257 /DNA_START=45 /DNA_END=1580 /DNA_ORIENTATION=-
MPEASTCRGHASAPQDVELTQTQVVASQHTRQRAAFKDQDVCARLTSLTDASVCYELSKDQRQVEIGRHPNCHIRVDDKRSSGVHLRIFRDENFRYYVEELSPNGCFINKYYMRKGDTRALQHGDEVSLCVYARSKEEKAFAAYLFTLVANGDSSGLVVAMPRALDCSGGAVAGDGAGVFAGPGLVTPAWVCSRWDMRTIIGSGNFSEVRLGVHVQTGEQRALKVINKKSFWQFQRKRDSRLSLKSEAETLISLSHEGIVRVYEWFETEAHLYLVMELLSDGDLLACILDHGCFTEPQARRLFKQLCEAVRYLHEKNVVHRDLKPENILVVGKDRNEMGLKIADFGLAWRNMTSGDCQTFCGTPHYLSPEVINTFQDRASGQSAGYGKQVDMWSLGVILYVMLSGVPPFEDEGLYEQILEGRFEFDVREWLAVSPDAKDLVRQLMTVNALERLNITQTLDHRWLRFSPPLTPPREGAPTADQRPAPGQEDPAAKRRRAEDVAGKCDANVVV